MTFDTISFLLFMAVMLLIFYLMPVKYRKYLLFLGSVIFYISLDWKVFCLALGTVIITFFAAGQIEKQRKQGKSAKLLLTGTVAVVILILGIAKYLNFFSEIVDIVLHFFGVNHTSKVFELLAMIGISYYSLKAVGYLVEVYRGSIKAEKSLVSYATYLLFFPQIIAGPIDTPDNFLTQINEALVYKEENIKKAIALISTGYMKKLVIANVAAGYVNTVYGATDSQNGLTCLFGAILYSMQIYCDFSGYSDISIGVSALFGIDVKANFNCPYLSVSIKDFWRRWHISLSSWLRNYIYIPCGGSRKGNFAKIRNTLITFLVSGLWHGAAFTFVFWGLYHGILNCFCKKVQKQENVCGTRTLLRFGKIAVTFLLVTVGWIFFRADSFGQAFQVLAKICMEMSFSMDTILQTVLVFTGDIMSLGYFVSVVGMNGLLLIREYRYTYGKLAEASEEKKEKETLIWTAFCIFAIICLGDFGTQGFIYANF
jgi:D-alanyl-lipoteichoic acid acyltransferase DltB (MBOAT superfamily)